MDMAQKGEVPRLSIVCNELATVKHKWKEIGTQLGISKEQIKQCTHPELPFSGAAQFLGEVLDFWLKGNTSVSPTWESVVSALESVGEKELSLKLNVKYCHLPVSQGIRELFVKACKEVLTVSEQQVLSSQFQSDPSLVYHIGLTPQNVPQLVEKNPTIAIEALLNLTTSGQMSKYFETLLNMDMSLHSMEMVNRLAIAGNLPPEFLHLYISNCMQRCRDYVDKSHQSRLVRLVCVFLQSVIRNKIINIQDYAAEEIKSFCLQFSKIREAAALYRLLKFLGSEGTEGQIK